MNDPKIKQQIAEKIKNSSNILVTVSKDPSVDELSAALGLTLLLNKLDKHATAIFSSHVPPAITFLEPDKTFEGTTDSLRDFIIALDKEKADHLRYKLEGDLVKIYITPYRTTITGDDLEFSQGDYNVELVIALGVEDKDHLDSALDGHGKILHDATVVTLTAGEQVSSLGSIDWHDSNASSLSEMLTNLQDAMKLDKGIMDQSIATAFLTGIVAATDRFSNPRTSSRVMTIAAQLMAAGADQQLIAARLEEAEPEEEEPDEPDLPDAPSDDSGEVVLAEGESTKLPKQAQETEQPKKQDDGELLISHQKEGTLEEVAEEVNRERLEESARTAKKALEKREEEAANATEVVDQPHEETPVDAKAAKASSGAIDYTPGSMHAPMPMEDEPLLGGTLNATSEQAEEDKRREIENDKNKVILSHNYIDQKPTYDAPVNSVAAGEKEESLPDVFKDGPVTSSAVEPAAAPTVQAPAITPPSETMTLPAPAPIPEPEHQEVTPTPTPAPAPVSSPEPATPAPQISISPTLADIDAENRAPHQDVASHDEARAAIDAAFAASPQQPADIPLPPPPTPEDMGLPLPPPLPTDFSAGMPPLPPVAEPEPERLGDILAPESTVPAPPLLGAVDMPPPQPVAPSDPGQFRIPGQG